MKVISYLHIAGFLVGQLKWRLASQNIIIIVSLLAVRLT